MIRKYIYNLIYFCIFISLVIPLMLNIKINEMSNNLNDINSQILILERQLNTIIFFNRFPPLVKSFINEYLWLLLFLIFKCLTIKLKHNDVFSIANIDKLSKSNSYQRLEVSQKINKLEIPYKLNSRENEKIAVLGFGK